MYYVVESYKGEGWISREIDGLVQGHMSRELAEQDFESESIWAQSVHLNH